MFGDFFGSCILSEPRAARFRPVVGMVGIQSATAEIRRGKKIERR